MAAVAHMTHMEDLRNEPEEEHEERKVEEPS
jgi:hypothetical protein